MRTLTVGTKLKLRTWHQNYRKFEPLTVIGEVVEDSTKHPHKMSIRVYCYEYDKGKGYKHQLLRVTDTIWLVRIGYRKNADGTTNLPHVFEIGEMLTEEEFKILRDKFSEG